MRLFRNIICEPVFVFVGIAGKLVSLLALLYNYVPPRAEHASVLKPSMPYSR